MNALDQIIASVNPQAALRRQRARLQLDALRRYDGASRGRRTEGWLTQGTSADAAAGPALKTLRDRSRDLVRNNPYAAKAVAVIVSNTVGTGILGQARAVRSRRRSQQLTDLLSSWANDPQQCDYHGRMDFAGLQALAMRCVVESGEVLIRRRTAISSSNQRVPLQLQIMEPTCWMTPTTEPVMTAASRGRALSTTPTAAALAIGCMTSTLVKIM